MIQTESYALKGWNKNDKKDFVLKSKKQNMIPKILKSSWGVSHPCPIVAEIGLGGRPYDPERD